jgi:hypothetical protein
MLIGGGGPELVLVDVDGNAGALGADDSSGDYQLHGRDIVEQSRPGDRHLHTHPGRELTPGLKQNAAAGEIYSTADAGFEHPAAAYEIPPEIETDPVPLLAAAFAIDLVSGDIPVEPFHMSGYVLSV